MTVATCPHGFPEVIHESADISRWRSSHCGLMDVQAARATLAAAQHVNDSVKREDLECSECNGNMEIHSKGCRWAE